RRHPGSWYAATAPQPPPAEPVVGAVTVDHCVIGGGFAGLGAALRLAQAGHEVRLIEAGPIGWGASGRNGGQVHVGWNKDQPWLERR
ncbi:FAD-dependent oxidoreductase, partial [Acinetobacter baumannii]